MIPGLQRVNRQERAEDTKTTQKYASIITGYASISLCSLRVKTKYTAGIGLRLLSRPPLEASYWVVRTIMLCHSSIFYFLFILVHTLLKSALTTSQPCFCCNTTPSVEDPHPGWRIRGRFRKARSSRCLSPPPDCLVAKHVASSVYTSNTWRRQNWTRVAYNLSKQKCECHPD